MSYITLLCGRKKTAIDLSSILQICVFDKCSTIHLKNGIRLSTYTPISKIATLLPQTEFYRIRKNCIVAFHAIEKNKNNHYQLLDGTPLKISRKEKQTFSHHYNAFLASRGKETLASIRKAPITQEAIEQQCSVFDLYPDPIILLQIEKNGVNIHPIYVNIAMEKLEQKSQHELIQKIPDFLPIESEWQELYQQVAFHAKKEEGLKFFPTAGKTMRLNCYAPFYGYCAVIITDAKNSIITGNYAVTDYNTITKIPHDQLLFSYYEKMLYILTQLYEQVVFVNLNENHYSIITDCFSYFQNNTDISGTFDELFLKYRTIVHPEFRREFSDVFVREPLLASFQSGAKEIVRQYQERNSDGSYHWVSCHVLRLANPYGNDTLAVVLKNTYEKEQRIIENNERKEQILQTLGNDFLAVYYADLRQKKVIVIKESDKGTRTLGKLLEKNVPSGIHTYIHENVHPEDQKFLLEKTEISIIGELLKIKNFFTINFRKKNHTEKYERVQLTVHAAKIQNERIDEIVIAIRKVSSD